MYYSFTAWKVSKYGVFSGPYFPVFGRNTEIYEVNLRIQSEYRKTRTTKNSIFGHFSRSVFIMRFTPYKIIQQSKRKLKESKRYWSTRGKERCLSSKAVQGKILLGWIYLQYLETLMVESCRILKYQLWIWKICDHIQLVANVPELIDKKRIKQLVCILYFYLLGHRSLWKTYSWRKGKGKAIRSSFEDDD